MDEALKEVVSAWHRKAASDLEAAKTMHPRDAAIFHCQQAGEKILKCYLALVDHPLMKTHDLRLLLNACTAYAPGMGAFMPDAALLTPYTVKYRYPNLDDPADDMPGLEELVAAIAAAQRLVDYSVSLLPPEVYPAPSDPFFAL